MSKDSGVMSPALSLALGFCAVVMLGLLVGGAIYVANRVEILGGESTEYNLYITITGFVMLTGALTRFYAWLIRDLAARRPISPLNWPIAALASVLFAIIGMVALSSLDLLRNDMVPTWTWLRDRDLIAFTSALYLLIFVTMYWKIVVIARSEGRSRWSVWGEAALLVVMAVCVMLIAVHI